MGFKFNRILQYYYFILMVLLLGGFGTGLFFYWTEGTANIENVHAVFNASIKFDQLKKNDAILEIKKMVVSDKARDAVRAIGQLETTVRMISIVHDSEKESRQLKTAIGNVKLSLNGLITSPKISTIISVLRNKISGFEKLVGQNRWQTLSRMGKRMKGKLPQRRKEQIFFDVSRIAKLTKGISQDIRVMKNVTESSVLSQQSKNIILIKLRTLGTEIIMLAKYLSHLKKFNTEFNVLKTNFEKWAKSTGPAIALKRIKFERSSKMFLIILMGLFGLIFVGACLGIFVYRFSSNRNGSLVERTILETVNEGIIPFTANLSNNFSSMFQDELGKFREYVHKRMSFGSIFREAVPFSSVLLDSNLNLIWANSIFYSDWNLTEYNKNKMSINWEYLQRFTNLGENDPVLSALNKKVSGIFQIQLRANNSEDSVPYEMYVSPVEYAGETRIMIFFYPLRFLEETIANQATSLVGPVSRTLDALNSSDFDQEFMEKIKKDFEIAGIEKIYSRFVEYNDLVSRQKSGLMREIERLENNLYDQYKLVDDLKNIVSEKNILYKETLKKFRDVKRDIVSLVDLRGKIERFYLQTSNTAKGLFQDELELLSGFGNMRETLQENMKAFDRILKVRDDFKKFRGNIDDFKARIIQSLDHLLIFQKDQSEDNGIQQILSKIKMEIRGFEKILIVYGKIATDMDVCLSKIELIMDRNELPDSSRIKVKFDKARDCLEDDGHNVSKIVRLAHGRDEEVICNLKAFFGIFQEGKIKLNMLETMLAENKSDRFKQQNEHGQDTQDDGNGEIFEVLA